MIVSSSDVLMLNMNISGREFAKAKLMQYLSDPGYLVSFLADGSCVFKSWCFSGTQEGENTMFMTGSPFEGNTLLEILTGPSYREVRFDVFEKVRSAFEQAIEQSIALPLSGPEGTIIGSDGSLLFLPQEYMQRSVSFLSDAESSRLYGCYYHAGLNHTDSLRFMLSVYAYQILTDRLPFAKKSSEERIEDYIDRNFIPPELWNPQISGETARIINNNLSISSCIKKNKKKKDALHEQFDEIKSVFVSSFSPSIKPEDILHLQEKEQRSAVQRVKYSASLSQKIRFKRFFRKKDSIIKISSVITAVVLIAVVSIIRDNRDKPTTTGLTPIEVIESFYTSINILDVELAASTFKKSAGNTYKDLISSFYVINKLRTAYDSSSQTLHPAQWLYNNRDFADWMYGITRLKIDGIDADAFSKHVYQKTHKAALTETKGSKNTYLATYYLVRHEGKQEIFITQCSEEVELEFVKNRWLISKITSSNTETSVNADIFNNEYASIDTSLDVYAKSEILSKNYPWIPGDKEITKALEELKARYEQYAF